jgi:signal recognition particle subunit SEC65
VARVARARGARFVKRSGRIVPLDAASEAVIGETIHDVANDLGFTAARAYLRAPPAERQAALERLRAHA